MSRLLVLCAPLLVALLLAPAAFADGAPAPAVQGGPGIVNGDGTLRYVAVPADTGQPGARYTTIESIQTSDGQLRSWYPLNGSWGLPTFGLGYDALGNGISADGKTLVLAETQLAPLSKFLVLDARTFRLKDWITVHGSYTFDAMSPDASRVFLIQYTQKNDFSHYVVRAYDLHSHRLLPGRVADRTQRSWLMQGYPVTRTMSSGGRWVYTLYANPGGYPFVHALDTVRGVAHCVGLPFTGSQAGLSNVVLSLRSGGRTLAVHWRSGRPWFDVDTVGWRVSAARPAGAPWRSLGFGGLGIGAAAALGAVTRLRRRREGTRAAREA